MLIDAEITVGAGKPALVVPTDAVQQINGQDTVFVRTAPDRFVLRAVRVGRTTNAKTPVLEGLASGEQVVVRGSFVLKSHLLRSTTIAE
jgi:cobalt-zinc-cadmium efflux system membrane fusion protein